MARFHVYVTQRDLATYEVEAENAEEARQRYRLHGIQVSIEIENGTDEVTDVDLVEEP